MAFQFIIQLTHAKQDALNIFAAEFRGITENPLKTSGGKLIQARDRLGMPQQTFRRHDHERLAPTAQDVSPQAMKILGWRGGIHHLQIVLCCQVKKSFQSSAGVLWSRALKSMWQQEDQPTQALPFVLRTRDELIHDRLRHIPKISILRLPKHQTFRAIEAIAIFKP